MANIFVELAINAVQGLIQLGQEIIAAIEATSEDQTYRSGWTQQVLGIKCLKVPGRNVVFCYTDHDPSGLVNPTATVLECTCVPSGDVFNFQCYAFDSGVFILNGDGGYLTWALAGDFTRDGNTVTFSKLGS